MASYKEGQGGRPIHGTVAGILTPWWTTIETNRVGVIAIIFVPSVYNRSSSIALPLDLDDTIHHEFRIYRFVFDGEPSDLKKNELANSEDGPSNRRAKSCTFDCNNVGKKLC